MPVRQCFAFLLRLIGFSCLVIFCGWTIELSHGDRYFLKAWGPSKDSTNFNTFFCFFKLLSNYSEAKIMAKCDEKCGALVNKWSENPVRKHISDGQGK